MSPIWVPRLCLQCIAAPLGGASATILTTPLDAIRARIQVIALLLVITDKHFVIVVLVNFNCLHKGYCDQSCLLVSLLTWWSRRSDFIKK